MDFHIPVKKEKCIFSIFLPKALAHSICYLPVGCSHPLSDLERRMGGRVAIFRELLDVAPGCHTCLIWMVRYQNSLRMFSPLIYAFFASSPTGGRPLSVRDAMWRDQWRNISTRSRRTCLRRIKGLYRNIEDINQLENKHCDLCFDDLQGKYWSIVWNSLQEINWRI